MGLGLSVLVACISCDKKQGFTQEEVAVITAPAPEGRSDYEGKVLRVWKIDKLSDSLLLRSVAQPVTEEMVWSEEYARLRERMLVTVRDSLDEGVGIAAPQVGISRQVIAVQRFDKEGEPFEFYLNPEILERSDSTVLGMEGCLSVPYAGGGNIYGKVARSAELKLRYRTEDFRDTVEVVKGFSAVIFQHEVDHLNGVLFVDRMVPGSETIQ